MVRGGSRSHHALSCRIASLLPSIAECRLSSWFALCGAQGLLPRTPTR